MAMDRINSHNLVRPGLVDKYKGAQRSSGSDKTSASDRAALDQQGLDKGSARSSAPADSVQISDAARKLVDLRAAVDVGRAALEATPEVREDKVAEARKRLDQGYYNSPEVQDKVAGRLSQVVKGMEDL